ncbi:hypothetical protein [Hungatella effluvii]|uniref:hypothetical protein n=1 Tax=Hungatella effluvii TaxID=1096246 RepID=UPI0022E2A526|nr:hypothetical protein [Hungatella effluvii]
MKEQELSAAVKYSQMFDPYRVNPPYVPEDNAALYFARLNVLVDGRFVGLAHFAQHVKLEDLGNDRFLLQVCRDYPQGEQLYVIIENCIYPGRNGERNVRNAEFALVCMGALGFPVSEKLEAAYSYDEILQTEQETGIANEISLH